MIYNTQKLLLVLNSIQCEYIVPHLGTSILTVAVHYGWVGL